MISGDTLILAPMAGITTPALRCLVHGFGGCDLYFTEMISAAALLQNGPYEASYLVTDPDPDRLVYQLVGGREEPAAAAAEYLDSLPGRGVDFNMGCSAPEIVKNGAGVAWMRDTDRARRLAGMLRGRVRTKSLSVKLRVGYDDDFEYLLSFCRGLADEGVDFITLHPRIKKEKFSRLARWDYVAALKRELPVPVVGNGDVRSWEEYLRLKTRYRPDGIMIGRSAARAPWFFSFLRARERNPNFELEVNLEEVADRFLVLLARYQPADFLESRAKRYFAYFCRNLLFGHGLMTAIQNAEGFAAVESLVRAYFREHPEARIKIEKN